MEEIDRTCRQISRQVNGEGDRAGGEQVGRQRDIGMRDRVRQNETFNLIG